MIETAKCDRCGISFTMRKASKACTKYVPLDTFDRMIDCDTTGNQIMHYLCPECQKKFKEFMKGEDKHE